MFLLKSPHGMPGMSFTVTEPDHLINYAINYIPYCPCYTEHHLMVHMNFNNLALSIHVPHL